MKSLRGFSLLELLIVMAMIGIVSAFAFPAYQDYVTRGKIAEATSGLAEMRMKIEQYFADNRTYTGFPCAQPGVARYFNFTCNVAAGGATYTIQATGRDNSGVLGFTYTINQSNTRTSTTPSWGSSGCWIVKKDGSC